MDENIGKEFCVLREDEEIKKIGARIAFYRKQNQLTQHMLAEKADISKSYLSKIESMHAKTRLSLGLLYRIAWALHIEPFCLLRPIQEDYLGVHK